MKNLGILNNHRSISYGSVMYHECMTAFRLEHNHTNIGRTKSRSILILPFKILDDIEFENFSILKSKNVSHIGIYDTNISWINNPYWVDCVNPHLFGISIATILSVITSELCDSTIDGHMCRIRSDFSDYDLHKLAIHSMTSNAEFFERNNTVIDIIKISEVIKALYDIDYEKYIHVAKAFRLIYLSMFNNKNDFGLSFTLLVAAIETIAQEDVSKKDVSIKNPNDAVWRERSKEDHDFKNLHDEYKRLRGNDSNLKKRYMTFIEKHFTSDMWGTMTHVNPTLNTYDDLISAIDKTYTYRSSFIHSGTQPPHRDIGSFYNDFLQYQHNVRAINGDMLLSIHGMLVVARESIINWLLKNSSFKK